VSFNDVDFSKSESFYDHPANWPSSIQHLVQLAELQAARNSVTSCLSVIGFPGTTKAL
jgi:hypothetical protein